VDERATRAPDSDVSAVSARHLRVKSRLVRHNVWIRCIGRQLGRAEQERSEHPRLEFRQPSALVALHSLGGREMRRAPLRVVVKLPIRPDSQLISGVCASSEAWVC